MTDLAIALVDYDNVRTKDERTPGDVVMNLGEIIPPIVAEAERSLAQPRELVVRVYGGWVNERGHQSRRAQWLLTALAWYRGRRGNAIVKPSLVTALACRSSDVLLGTVRESETGVRQKMVDAMLGLDALHFARDQSLPVLIVSDDDDLVPAALSARSLSTSCRVHWLRRRRPDSALNDSLLGRAGVTFGSFV